MKHNWTYQTIEACYPHIKNGANIKQIDGAAGIPITRIETLSGGVFNRNRMGYADIIDADIYKDYILEDGDLLMSHINSKAYIGRTVEYKAKKEEQFIHGMNLLRLKGNNGSLLSSFFAYYTQSSKFKADIARIRKDAVNQSSFAISDLKNINIPVPDVNIQRSVIEELDQINVLIAIKEKQLRELEELEQTIFHEMFGDPVINDKKWLLQQLNSFAKVKGRVGWKGYKKTDLREDGPYVIGATHLAKDGTIDLTAPVFISREKYEESPEIYIERGDVIIAQRGSIGKVGLVEEEIGEATINPCVLIVRPENVDGQYLLGYFLHEHMQHELIMMSTGGVQPMITQKQLNELMVPYPDLEFQEAYHQKILVIKERKIELLKSKNDLEELLASRMQYWFD